MSARIIPQEALSAYQRWELAALREEHQTKARPTGGQSAESLEALKRSKQEEGYRIGYAAGNAAAREELERLRALTGAVERQIAQLEQGVASEIVDLALELARHVLRGELAARREALVPAVREAMGALSQSASRKLLLHPSDVDTVRAHLGEDLQLGDWQIMEDHLIEPGGCRIVAPDGEVDATLATRWKRVLSGLGRSHAWHDPD